MNSTKSSNVCLTVTQYYLGKDPPDVTCYTWFRGIFYVLYCTVFTVGLCGNIFVIYAISRHKRLQTVRNLFIFSLSLSDSCVCLLSLPVTAYVSLHKEWIFGTEACKVLPLLQCMSIIISTFTLGCIAIDRFILIMFPTKKSLSKNQSIAMIFTVWVVASLVGIPSALHFQLFPGTKMTVPLCGSYCLEYWGNEPKQIMIRKLYGWAVLMVQFVLPLSLIFTCYGLIFAKVNRGQKIKSARMAVRAAKSRTSDSVQLTEAQKSKLDREVEVMKRARRTNMMLIGMVVGFAVSWLFQVLLNIIEDAGFRRGLFDRHYFLFKIIAHFLAMTSVMWNPILYGYLNESFRAAIQLLVPTPSCWQGSRRMQVQASKGNLRSYLQGHANTIIHVGTAQVPVCHDADLPVVNDEGNL